MPRKLDGPIADVLKEYGFGPEACWDCHGTWVVYHKVLEQIAAKAGIRFEPPMIIEASSADKIVALCATGALGDKAEWSIGEAAPGNNKNSYPYAMAEKRAKDRVILKLIGLHGLAYSEDEADDFKESKPKGGETFGGPLTKTDLKTKMRAFAGDLAACDDLDTLVGLETSHRDLLDQCMRDLPDWWYGDGGDNKGAMNAIEAKRAELTSQEAMKQGFAA